MKKNISSIISAEKPFFTHLVDNDDFIEHSHTHIELFYIISGEVTHVLNSEAKKLETGNLVFVLPGDTHYFNRPATAIHRDIFFSEEFLRNTVDHIKLDYNDLINVLKQRYFNLSLEQIKTIESLSKNFIYAFLNDKKMERIIDNMVLIYILNVLYSHTKTNGSLVNMPPQWITELAERFENVSLLEQGLPAIISHLHYNKVYINNTFKKYVGKSLSEYLTERRLEYAILYMKIYSFSLEIISMKLGFCSLSYFFKQFKKKYGVTPREYQKKYLK